MNLACFLSALALIESGNNDNAVGKHGELGRYQISEVVWYQHSPGTFTKANVKALQEQVTCGHLRWLSENMPVSVRYDPLWLAAAWNCGLSRCEKAKWKFVNLPKSTQRAVRKFKKEYDKANSKT